MTTFSDLRRSDPDYFEFDWFDVLVDGWAPDTDYVVGDVVRPHRGPVGFVFQCTTKGTSGGRRPRWRGPAATTIADGGAVLTAKKREDASLPTITSATYTITPTGITKSGEVIDGTKTRVKLDASAAALGDYEIVAEIVASSEDYSDEATFEVVD